MRSGEHDDGEPEFWDTDFRDMDFRATAREVLDLLREDPDAPSPVARRLREVILDGLPAGRVGAVAAFDRDPYAPAAALALASVLSERAAADPEFADRVQALLQGRLGNGGADERWAEQYGGRVLWGGWFLIAAVIALFVLNAFAACAGPPPDIP
ncbi:hypothetical protein M8Z33_08375 [Streptomyces sp. ZAF1911]|uniref:hypothetical protein n=1 Tax=Streptomyces sp. ZAF1911 TaxID=2944129 RepID=UPI00237C0F1B|nr:hypothetical protein [Streptomyces sp. ZAF1911]MDD9376686.1 hypothetical protein [Streptomyces sp. ZAF1911]